MSFDDAIPVSRIAYGQPTGFDFGAPRQEARERRHATGPRQSVNISEETMMRVARAKLGRMVSQRLGYDRQGAMASEPTVGTLLSTKA